MRERSAARVLVVNDENEVLLLLHDRPQDAPHWAPPGGGIQPNESPLEAVERELFEETGLEGLQITGPHWLWQHHFSYFGVRIRQSEALYLAHVGVLPTAHATDHHALDGITAARWWPVGELRDTPEDVWPHGLAEILGSITTRPTAVEGPRDLGLTTRG